MFDYKISGALIYDGTGKEPYKADVLISAEKIVKIANKSSDRARFEVNGDNLILSPGFIDIHTHTDLAVLNDRNMWPKIKMGITTDVSGNCGLGTFPASLPLPSFVSNVLGEWNDWSWDDFTSYSEYIERRGMGINEIFLTSHSALRLKVMENASREASEAEIEKMCALLERSIEEGSLGLSTGLYYVPCSFASRKEILELLKTVGKKGSLFAVHHRCEGNGVVSSLKEVLELSKEAGCRIEVSHLKAIGKKNQRYVPEMLTMIEKYRRDGVDVYFDQYPYTFGSTNLFSLLPSWVLCLSSAERKKVLSDSGKRERVKKEIMEGDGWDSIYEMVGPEDIRVLYAAHFPQLSNLSLSEIAREVKKDPLDALLDLLTEETGLAVMSDVTQSEENLRTIMTHPLMSFGSDALYSSPIPHPRSYHATVKFLSRYVRDEKVMTVEEGIRKLTGANADRIGLKDRGYIKEGYAADLILFSLDELGERGNENTGFKFVMLNGKPCLDEKGWHSALSGKVIRF